MCDVNTLQFWMYTDGKMKRYSKICHVLQVAQKNALHKPTYQNPESSLGVILICRFSLPGMLPYKHVYIVTAVTIFPS